MTDLGLPYCSGCGAAVLGDASLRCTRCGSYERSGSPLPQASLPEPPRLELKDFLSPTDKKDR